ncbi:MAG: Glu/Leu/Phe/Val dehydrogenase [Deltaproteobacteria bacterium]|nr:Glu/Leu/Phe/Val dehydrogenase [Deltaproteobacteria bacterium]
MTNVRSRAVSTDPFRSYQDASGPERIFSFYDPISQMRAVLVIDTTAFGVSAGGIRMLPDLSLMEMVRLARAMTYKYLMLEVQCGGAKAGVWYDSTTQDRQAVWNAFLAAIHQFIEQRMYLAGTDMGTTEEDFQSLHQEGARPRSGSLLKQVIDGLPLEDQLTGFGVVESARAAAGFFGISMQGATVAIEGFGKVGGGAARFCARAGARVVAVSTIAGTRYDPAGLDIEQLFLLRRTHGDNAVCHYPHGKLLSCNRLFSLPVDILIPGARPDVITAKNVEKVQARLIAPGANIPFTNAIANQLSARGVGVVPDFVANGGGVLAALADLQGLDVAAAFRSVSERITANTTLVLTRSRDNHCTPVEAAIQICQERWRQKVSTGRVLAE